MVNIYEVLWHLLCQNRVTHFSAKIMVIKVNYLLVRIVKLSTYVLSCKIISMNILYFNIHKCFLWFSPNQQKVIKPDMLTYILQRVMANGIPDSWNKRKLIPIFKNKGDIFECSNYRGIKLMSHFMKLWERIIEARLREMVNIRDNQFGFRPGISTTDTVFAFRQRQEKCREK